MREALKKKLQCLLFCWSVKPIRGYCVLRGEKVVHSTPQKIFPFLNYRFRFPISLSMVSFVKPLSFR